MELSFKIALAVTVCCLASCAAVKTASPSLPADRVDNRGQLVIHTNFDLPNQHRLLDELTALRDDICNRLGLQPSQEPIHVYLFQTSEQFNTFIKTKFPQFPNRRAFFVETDTRLAVYAYWGDHVGEDLRHEVAHGYMHSMTNNLPLWLDEGLAEYFEVPRGHRGFNRPNLEELAELHRQGKWLPDMRRMERFASAGAMQQADYDEAWSWAHWLLETDAAHRELLQNYLKTVSKDNTQPLSLYIRRLPGDPHKELAGYVDWLIKQPPY